MVLPGVGGITYNVRIGDPAVGWEADHMEPGVSIKNLEKKEGSRGANDGLNTFACIGNEAVVMSGAAKEERGTVTGKHGGIEHVLVDFGPEIKEKMVIGDKIQVKGIPTEMEVKYKEGDCPSYYSNIAAHLLRGKELEVKPEEGWRVIAVMETAERSAASGKTEPVPVRVT